MAEEYPGATPEERKIVEDQIRDRISKSPEIPAELKSALLASIHIFHEIKYERPRSTGSLGWRGPNFQIGQLGWKRFAIKDDYLKFMETMGAAGIAITTSIAVPATSPAVTAISLLVAGAFLADRLASKGASLTKEEYRLLMCLKAHGPISADQLGVLLSGLHIAGSDFWTGEETTKALNDLEKKRLADGTIEALVVKTSDDLWSVNGI